MLTTTVSERLRRCGPGQVPFMQRAQGGNSVRCDPAALRGQRLAQAGDRRDHFSMLVSELRNDDSSAFDGREAGLPALGQAIADSRLPARI